jgi:hypothetical protein
VRPTVTLPKAARASTQGAIEQLPTTVPFAAVITIFRLDKCDVFILIILIAISGWRGTAERIKHPEWSSPFLKHEF